MNSSNYKIFPNLCGLTWRNAHRVVFESFINVPTSLPSKCSWLHWIYLRSGKLWRWSKSIINSFHNNLTMCVTHRLSHFISGNLFKFNWLYIYVSLNNIELNSNQTKPKQNKAKETITTKRTQTQKPEKMGY